MFFFHTKMNAFKNQVQFQMEFDCSDDQIFFLHESLHSLHAYVFVKGLRAWELDQI